MLFTGYQGWIDGVRDWLDVDDYSDGRIDSFIQLATARLNTDLMSTRMEKSTEFSITSLTAAKPLDIDTIIPDFNKIRLVTHNGYENPAETVAINELRRLQLLDVDVVNPYFAIDSWLLYIYPSTKEDDVIEVKYYEQVVPISATLDNNTFTDYHANILLYACGLEAAPYMVEDERTTMWAQMYKSLVDNINAEASKEKMGSVPLRRRIIGY
jgi:hypothetical protein